MIIFIDTEVNQQTQKVADFGAVREDGAVLHTKIVFSLFNTCGSLYLDYFRNSGNFR